MNWWLAMGRDLTLLAAESGEVMVRRSLKLLRGNAAALTEAQLMISEKIEATIELQRRLVTGQLGSNGQAAARAALNHVRRKVRANRSRLRRGGPV
jgi:hypothetical protein